MRTLKRWMWTSIDSDRRSVGKFFDHFTAVPLLLQLLLPTDGGNDDDNSSGKQQQQQKNQKKKIERKERAEG
ncbi:unnamed protein product [Enterobius vermicularis]|uniref:Uncharacterized protein n=1 Tax=Enterobius vermicularis TaxID=51028 RepID=A0A0N4VRJ3_ENTVE|nr:unnamed protein product [Enterobius vermicularis]